MSLSKKNKSIIYYTQHERSYSKYFEGEWDKIMPLIRKTRLSRNNIVVIIPSQLVEAYDISDGEDIEIIPLGRGELKIRKASIEELHGGGTY